jgi:hypothetical protein
LDFAVLKPGVKPKRLVDYGIEITVPEMLAEHAINLDHHDADKGNPTAIEQALYATLPRPQNLVATNRLDLDSLGAMAVIYLRWMGIKFPIDRVWPIARVDKRAGQTIWLRDLLTEPEIIDNGLSIPLEILLDRDTSVSEKVNLMAWWLVNEEYPIKYLKRAWPRQLLKEYRTNNAIDGAINCGKNVALVATTNQTTVARLYKMVAPVVVAYHRLRAAEPARYKYTISAGSPYYVVWTSLADDLNKLERQLDGEPGWGGPVGLVASPQVAGSRIEPHQVVELAQKRMRQIE